MSDFFLAIIADLLLFACAIVFFYVVSNVHRKIWGFIRSQIHLASELPKDKKWRYARTIFLVLGMLVGLFFWDKIIAPYQNSYDLYSFGRLMMLPLGAIISLALLECFITIIDAGNKM